MSDIDYRNKFRENVAAYDEVTQSRHIRLIYDLEKQVLSELLAKSESQNLSLMDFACGTGRWTMVLEKYFKETIGVDISSEMIALAEEKCQQAEFVVTDITSGEVDERLEGKKFDVVTAFRFYKNAEEKLRCDATKALAGYVKDEGLFIFDLHLNTFSFMGILACFMRLLRLDKLLGVGELTVRTISLGHIRKIFEDSSFEIVDYYGMGVLPGRSNFTILPGKILYAVESFFTRRKILRRYSYNILVVARKKG